MPRTRAPPPRGAALIKMEKSKIDHTPNGTEFVIQQPKGDNALFGIVATAVLPGIVVAVARAIGSIVIVKGIVVFPTHGDSEGTTGVGTTISGLMPPTPTSNPVVGTVASPYVNAVVVPRPGMFTAILDPNASIVAAALAAGLHAPVMIDEPKG
jgi:hypothetical protein